MSRRLARIGGRVTYDRHPSVAAGAAALCHVGWPAVAAALGRDAPRCIVVEAYPGTRLRTLEELARGVGATRLLLSEDALRPVAEIERLVAPDLGNDPVFGRLSRLELASFFDPAALQRLRTEADAEPGRVVVAGVGAALVTAGDVLVYADLPRWEIQQRQRCGESGNLGAANAGALPAEIYKRSYFVDWRVADRHKFALWNDVDWFLDASTAVSPKLVAVATIDAALAEAARRPFRVVPFFDPAPWGGQWMREVCGLPQEPPNFGWCFDCVPEENGLALAFGDSRFELPALDLVVREARALLGSEIVARYGAEFPIRFDFLDTIGGGNLSVQVHPQRDYMRRNFGLGYTQDESYYLLDADPGAHVHLGVVDGTRPESMIAALRRSEHGEEPFPATHYVGRFPARQHDHFLIPAGTVHGSGAGSMVLEISSTPYIFTFKLYDWDRPGLDGRPRPLHIDRGAVNIRFDRDGTFARRELINCLKPLESGPGWRSERTGLHAAEILETHRHWFTGLTPHADLETVQVLNLVAGEAAVVESPDGAFAPFEVHYAETFIVPAAAGPFTLRPLPRSGEDGEAHATIKAFVRSAAATESTTGRP